MPKRVCQSTLDVYNNCQKSSPNKRKLQKTTPSLNPTN